MRAGAGEARIWEQLQNQTLGDEKFVEKLQRSVASAENLREVPRAQRHPMAKPLENYQRKGREGIAQAYLSSDYTMQEIADYFGIHYSTVSRIVKEYETQGDA